MSRHRNFHNLSEDDYDDYYDDYDEDGDDDWIRKANEAKAAKKKKSAAPKTPAATPVRKTKKPDAPQSSSSSATNKPPQQTATGTPHRKPTAGSAPPPGLRPGQPTVGKKPAAGSATGAVGTLASPTAGGVAVPPASFGGRPVGTTAGHAPSKTGGLKIDGDGSKDAPQPVVHAPSANRKKISAELQQRLKAQKSRLSMVILGHVDAGKSTLMGQVLVQMGIVQKRVVTKYEKEGK